MLTALADAASGFSPQVEQGDEAVYLEVGDLGRLFQTEEQLLQAQKLEAVGVLAVVEASRVSRTMTVMMSPTSKRSSFSDTVEVSFAVL